MKTTKLFWLAVLATGVGSAVPASASDAAMGTIYGVLSHDSGNAFFNQTGARTARPSCATEDRWAFDAKTPTGQAMLAVLLTAHATGRNVTIHGTGECSVWFDTETVRSIAVW